MITNTSTNQISHLDARAEPKDRIVVEVQEQIAGKTIYVHVNGETICRISRVKNLELVVP